MSMEVLSMLTCPICEHDLKDRKDNGWTIGSGR